MTPLQFQRNFLSKAGPNIETIRQIAEILPPDIIFNITDNQNRLVALNHANCENCNAKNELELVGKNIETAFPSVLADVYTSLYAEARMSDRPILNRVCTHAADRSTDLRIANVFTLHDKKGVVIGTAVFYRTLKATDILPEWYGPLNKAIRYIDEHFSEKLSLDSVSRLIGMGKTTFRRAFSATLNISPGEYISTIRLNRARQLLATTSLSLEQIAEQCGFYDVSHLIKTFKRFRHQTPAQYRKSHARFGT